MGDWGQVSGLAACRASATDPPGLSLINGLTAEPVS
jgi:hypothetical protein